MKLKTIAKCAALGLALCVMPLQAQTNDTVVEKKSRLTIGGYGEAVYTRNFYSDNMFGTRPQFRHVQQCQLGEKRLRLGL